MKKQLDQSTIQDEFTTLRAFLTAAGVKTGALNALTGAYAGERTRRQVAAALHAFLKSALKKA